MKLISKTSSCIRPIECAVSTDVGGIYCIKCSVLVKTCANERNMLRQHVGHNMLRSFVHHVGLCCMMLAYVASSLKPVKLFAQHMPTFLLFS